MEGANLPPRFVLKLSRMIDKNEVKKLVEEGLTDTDCFLVDVQIDSNNTIVVEIDNQTGVDIDECVRLSRYIQERLDRNIEDYELEVGSAGLTSPFKVLKQYKKNIGNEIEVLTSAGKKETGLLKTADENGFTMTVTKKIKPENAKRKIEVEEDLHFNYNEIKYTKYLIRFK